MKSLVVTSLFDPNRIDVFFLESGFHMAHVYSHPSGSWAGTNSLGILDKLGGVFTTMPAAVSSMARKPLVNAPVLGLDLPHPADAPHPAGALTRGVGGPGGVGTILDPQPRLDVFGLGTNYAMYHQVLWQGAPDATPQWANLGGVFLSAPTAIAAFGKTRVDVFGLGLDRALYQRTWNGEHWSPGWERLGGIFTSDASAVTWAPGRLDLFVRGSDFSLRHRANDGTRWLTDWQNLGGSLATAPVAVTWGPDRLDAFAVSHTGTLIHRWWDGMIWNEWEDLGFPGDKLTYVTTPSVVSWGRTGSTCSVAAATGNSITSGFDNGSWKGRNHTGRGTE